MGTLDLLQGKRVYFDANIFIYLLEGNEALENVISDIRNLIVDGSIQVISNDLVFTEILPFHAKEPDPSAIEHIIKFLDQFEITRITKNVTIHAGILRGETGMKTPDALHVASAIEQECDVFLTNDKGIRVPDGMERILILEL